MIKPIARRRFFLQCRDSKSVLWTLTPTGKYILHKFLFDAAAEDVVNLAYNLHPGPTNKIPRAKILSIIQWCVYKDRQNYLHKSPKRPIIYGVELPFNFKSELQKFNCVKTAPPLPTPQQPTIKQEQPLLKTQQQQPAPQQPRLPSPQQQPAPQQPAPQQNCIDVDNAKPCANCALAVWIGNPQNKPKCLPLAFPAGEDWKTSGSPYCESCWEVESTKLDNMGSAYKAAGKRTDSGKKQAKQAKKKAVAKKKVPAKKKVKKKKLGGVQGPLLDEESPPPRAVPDTAQEVRSKYEPSARLAKFKVGQRVDARFKNTRRYYGAFVTSANLDNTYSVYFYESSEECHHVQEAHIKLPLDVKCNRSFSSWDFFKGKVFSDPGTPGEFEAGDFIVESITVDNNFLCIRVGEEEGPREEFDIGYAIQHIRMYEELSYY